MDIFLTGECDALAVAVASLCQGCVIFAIKTQDEDSIHYICKLPSIITDRPYVDIIGSWTEIELLQYWQDHHLVEEIPNVSMRAKNFALPYAKEILLKLTLN